MTRLSGDAKRSAHLFFYLADEGGSVLNLGRDALDFQGSSLLVSGSREDVGDWQIHLRSEVFSLFVVVFRDLRICLAVSAGSGSVCDLTFSCCVSYVHPLMLIWM